MYWQRLNRCEYVWCNFQVQGQRILQRDSSVFFYALRNTAIILALEDSLLLMLDLVDFTQAKGGRIPKNIIKGAI